jgi:hypothetical protein
MVQPVQRVQPSHDVLGGVVQPGKEPVHIHPLRWKIIGVGRQQEEVDIVQMVYELGNALQVIEGGQSLLPGRLPVDVEGRTSRPGVDALPTEQDIVLLVLATERDLGRCRGYQLHGLLLGQAHQVLASIHPGPGTPEALQTRLRVHLKAHLFDYAHDVPVDQLYALFGKRLVAAALQSFTYHVLVPYLLPRHERLSQVVHGLYCSKPPTEGPMPMMPEMDLRGTMWH